jgi:signal transduction histidine kinase
LHKVRITKQALVILVIVLIASVLSVISYDYYVYSASKVDEIAENEIHTNTIIEADAVSKIISNNIDAVGDNLKTLTKSPAILNNNGETAKTLLMLRQNATKDLTESYFWLDKHGKVLWGTLAAEKPEYAKFIGYDFSNYDFFINAKKTFEPYYADVLNSVDGIPRIHIAYPIILQPSSKTDSNTSNSDLFDGIVAATIEPHSLAKLIGESLHKDFKNKIMLYDRNGNVLYSSLQPSFVGKNILDIYNKISSDTYNAGYAASNDNNDNGVIFLRLFSSSEARSLFKSALNDSLSGNSGSKDFVIAGTDATYAYTPILTKDNNDNDKHFLTLGVIAPHQLRNDVGVLVHQQKDIALITILIISATAAVLIFLVLTWNKALNVLVKERTKDLEQKTRELTESNRQVEKTNKEILLANEQLKGHDKMQNEFINIAAHELRTPTQAIIGYSEILELEPENSNIYVNPIIRNAKRLHRLSQDILDVTRIESQSLKLTKEKFELNHVILPIVEDSKSLLSEEKDNDATLDIVYEAKPIILEADKGRITQVIFNLLSNAIKFTAKEKKFSTRKEKETIHLKSEVKGSEVIVSVKDSGPGIDPEIMPRLFTKFASKASTGGTGLGLFISKSIVESHGGKIWAENNPDEGATFSFSLPINELV